MSTFLIIAVITGAVLVYTVVGTIAGHFIYKIDMDDAEDVISPLSGVLWPIAIPILTVVFALNGVSKGVIYMIENFEDILSRRKDKALRKKLTGVERQIAELTELTKVHRRIKEELNR